MKVFYHQSLCFLRQIIFLVMYDIFPHSAERRIAIEIFIDFISDFSEPRGKWNAIDLNPYHSALTIFRLLNSYYEISLREKNDYEIK